MKLTLLFCLLGSGLSFAQTTVPTYTVNTFAGSAPLGDGGPGASAILLWPGPLVFDNAGNLYIGDNGNASIRKVSPDGLITTFAGTGEAGFSGDGGPASQAQLSGTLNGLAIDSGGNLYISDAGNNRIRRVSAADGTISTYVDGSTLPEPETASAFGGIALDGAGNLYIAVTDHRQIFQITPDGTFSVFAGTGKAGLSGNGGPATQAAFDAPATVYIDASGSLYVCDLNPNSIRKITPDGIINAFAGGGGGFTGDGGPATAAKLLTPTYMAQDAAGNFYFVDFGNYRIRKIAADSTISTVAGSGTPPPGTATITYSVSGGDGGPATQAGFGLIQGLAVSAAGDLYISDWDSGIRVVTAADGMVRTAYGRLHFTEDGALASNAVLNLPFALAADGHGNLYLGDGYRVRKIDTNGVISTIAGYVSTIAGTVVTANTGDGGPATAASIGHPLAITVDTSGNVYFSSGATVRRVDTNGIITTIAGNGQAGYSGDGGPATQASLSSGIWGLAVDSSGSLYIADSTNHRIRKVAPDGTISTFAGTGTNGNTGNGGPATAARINQAYGLVFDPAGNLYFADDYDSVVRVISPDGTISAFAGTGGYAEGGDGGPATQAKLANPFGLAIDPAGSLYIADAAGQPPAGNTLRVVTPDGIIHTIASGKPVDLVGNAGASQFGGKFSGDGGPAIGADYCSIIGIALGGNGNIYVLDNNNERIRVLTPNQQ